MAVMAIHLASERGDLLIAGAVFSTIGVALIVLAPAKPSGERVSAAGAWARTLEKQALSRTGSDPPACVATLVN